MLPGFALASLTSSATFFGGKLALAAKITGMRPTSETGAKSLKVSKGRFLYTCGLTACVSNAMSSVCPSGALFAT